MPEIFCKFNLKPKQAWFYNAITAKSSRGKGYYPNIIRFMAKALEKEGLAEFFIDLDLNNIASRHGLEKAGCKRVVLIQMKKKFTNINYELVVSNMDDWQELYGIVEHFDKERLWHIMATKACL